MSLCISQSQFYDLADNLYYTDTPLTPAQAKRLAQDWLAAYGKTGGVTANVSRSDVIKQNSAIFSAPQIATLKQMGLLKTSDEQGDNAKQSTTEKSK